jgi:hypothetical protein
MKVFGILAAVAALSSGVASADNHKADNCEVKGKMTHVKDEKACKKAKGVWKTADHAAPAEGAAAHSEAAPSMAPAATK